MAYVHCHNCDWEQDDFWSWSYNPIRFFLKNELPWFIRPRMLGIDSYAMGTSKLARTLGLTKMKTESYVPEEGDGAPRIYPNPKIVRSYYEHSWYTLWRCFKKWVRRVYNQKWWTWKSYKEAGRPGCPKCGNGLCID